MKKLREFMMGWGGLIAALFVIAIITERTLYRVSKEKTSLERQLKKILEDKHQAQQRNAHLNAQINSQSDPAWIELVLKRELGLTPEGQTKVVFIERQK